MQGFEAKLYIGAAPLAGLPSTGTWSELNIVKDVTLNDQIDESDATTRANGGRKSTDLGLRDNSIEFELPWSPANANFIALYAGYTGKAAVALACMDGDIATVGKTGVAGNFKITGFTREEPLGGQVTAKVTAKAFSYVADYTIVA